MSMNPESTSNETLQQRLLEEVEAQERLQNELKLALESEKDLRLENEMLWVYLERKYPARVDDASELLARLRNGSDLTDELHSSASAKTDAELTGRRKIRRALGKVPGVRSVYHLIKGTGK